MIFYVISPYFLNIFISLSTSIDDNNGIYLDKLLIDCETAIGTTICLKDNLNAMLPSEISPHNREEQVHSKEVANSNRDEVSEMKLCVADLYVLGTSF